MRSSRNGTIGGTDATFRTTNKDLLSWINQTLNTSYSSISDASNGAAHCQLCHMVHPTAFGADWKKVNWTAKNEYELVSNYSILNRAFNKANIPQNVPVEALAKGKKVENLKFWQWMMGYWQMNERQVDEAYDTDKVRLKCKNGLEFARAKAGKPSATNFLQQSKQRRKRPGKLTHVKTSPRSSRAAQALESPHFRPPSPISTRSNKNSDLSAANDDIWPSQEEDHGFKYSSPNSPLSKHVQSWEKRKEDLIKSAEKNARFAPSLHRRIDAHHQHQHFHDNGNNKFVPQNFLQPWLEVQQGQQEQAHIGIYDPGTNMHNMNQQEYYGTNHNVTTTVNVGVNGVPHAQYTYGNFESTQSNAQGYAMDGQQYQQQPVYRQNYQSQYQQPPSYSSVASPRHNGGVAPYRSALPKKENAFDIDININTQMADAQGNSGTQYSYTKEKPKITPERKRTYRKRGASTKRREKPNPFRAKLAKKPEPRNDKPVPSYMRSTAATRQWKDVTAAEKRKPKELRTEIY